MLLLSEIEEEHHFYSLTSPLLYYEAMLSIPSCFVKQRKWE